MAWSFCWLYSDTRVLSLQSWTRHLDEEEREPIRIHCGICRWSVHCYEGPKELTDILEKKYKFKLKGTGPISIHIGMDFTRDEDNTLCISPTKYIDKLVKNYEKLFGMKPNTSVTSPLEKGDHPELDTSELCTTEQITQYQSIIKEN